MVIEKYYEKSILLVADDKPKLTKANLSPIEKPLIY